MSPDPASQSACESPPSPAPPGSGAVAKGVGQVGASLTNRVGVQLDRRKLFAWAVLGGLTLLAVWLRLTQVQESLWLDELHSSWVVDDSLAEIAPRAAAGNYSPCYFYLLKVSIQLLGHHEFGLRFPSLVAGVALVPLLYWVAASWGADRFSALLAAAWGMGDENFLFFAIEARPFAILQAIGLIQVTLFGKMLVQQTKGNAPSSWLVRIGFVITSLGLFYLHYTSGLLLLAEGCAWGGMAIASRFRSGNRPGNWGIEFAVIAVGCLPAVGHCWEIYQRRNNWTAFVNENPSAWQILTIFPLTGYLVLICLGLLAIAGIWSVCTKGRRDKRVEQSSDSRQTKERLPNEQQGAHPLGSRHSSAIEAESRPLLTFWVLAVCWLFVPLASAWLATRGDVAPLFFRRYLMVAACAPPVLLAMLLGRCRSWMVRGVISAALIVILLYGDRWLVTRWLHHPPLTTGLLSEHAQRGTFFNRSDEDWREAVQLIRQRGDLGSLPIYLDSGLIEAPIPGEESLGQIAWSDYATFPLRGIYQPGGAPDRRLIAIPRTWRSLPQREVSFRKKGGELAMKATAGTTLRMGSSAMYASLAESPTIEDEREPLLQAAVEQGGCWLVVRGRPGLANWHGGALREAIVQAAQDAEQVAYEIAQYAGVTVVLILDQQHPDRTAVR